MARDGHVGAALTVRLRHQIAGTFLALAAGLMLAQLPGDFSGGILPEKISYWLMLGHRDFLCPFCGGIRAFVFMCRLDWTSALHSSILASLGTCYMVLTLPCRIFCSRLPENRFAKLLAERMRAFESAHWLLVIAAVCSWLQLWLHYHGFVWYPFVFLMNRM